MDNYRSREVDLEGHRRVPKAQGRGIQIFSWEETLSNERQLMVSEESPAVMIGPTEPSDKQGKTRVVAKKS